MANTAAELVFIPAPGFGHIISTIEIAKLLTSRDQRLSITVLVMNPPSTPGSSSPITTYIESLANMATKRIRFIEVLPQYEIPQVFDPKFIINSVTKFINSHCKHVRSIVADMINGQPGSSRVVGFVIDMFCSSMIDVANEFSIPTYVFYTSNAAFLGFNLYIKTLCDDEKKDIIELVNSVTEIRVPTFVQPVQTKVFPSVFQIRQELDVILWCVRRLRGVKGIMVNTFLELETHAMETLSADISIPPVYAVGPILNLESGVGGDKFFENEVMSWLDGQPPSSVVFLCFGSAGSFDDIQVKEIAHGLEKSGQRFLWSLRRPPSDEPSDIFPSDYEDPGSVLPDGFLDRMVGIGKVIGWAPQVAVLAHRAVGGFVSHCGWNSLLESLWFGVPSATWPIYAEQQMNAFEMVVELGLAVEIKLDYKKDPFNPKDDTVIVSAKEIEGGIRRLMENDVLRTKVKEMSEKSRAAVAEGGSSYSSVGRLIDEFIKNI